MREDFDNEKPTRRHALTYDIAVRRPMLHVELITPLTTASWQEGQMDTPNAELEVALYAIRKSGHLCVVWPAMLSSVWVTRMMVVRF